VDKNERAAIVKVTKAHHDSCAAMRVCKDEHVRTLLVQRVAVSLKRRDDERQRGLPDLVERCVQHLPLREVPAAREPGHPAGGLDSHTRPRGEVCLERLELGSGSRPPCAPHPLFELVGLDATLEVGGTQAQHGCLSLAVGRQHAASFIQRVRGALQQFVLPGDCESAGRERERGTARGECRCCPYASPRGKRGLAAIVSLVWLGKAVAQDGFEPGEHVQRLGRSRLAEPAAKPASSGSAHDEHVALGAVNDLCADGPQQQPLERIEPATAHHDEVGVLGAVEDHVAWVALRLERLRVDAALR
jgi:hypothetical protein